MTHEKPHHPHPKEHHKPSEPYWKRAHHDWKFWVAIGLMLASMFVYIVTLNEAVQPDSQTPDRTKQPTP